jgi:threonine dehydratase
MPFSALRAVDVFAARRRLDGVVRRTPLRRSAGLSAQAGGDVYLKCENEQTTGSFKLRGAFNAIAALPAEVRRAGVVASSAGNHGLGVAFAARHFAVPATIFVPRTAPLVKKQGIADLGATVDESQPDYDAAMTVATAYAAERGMLFINPCLGATVLAGQGTVGLEIVEELPALAAVVVPVGGGGLLGGIASLVRRVAPHVRIIGAQSVNTAAMARSLAAGRVVDIPSVPTLADGLAGGIDEFALDVGRHALDEIVTLAEEEIASTIGWLAHHEGTKVEGSGAVAAGAVLHRRIAALPTPAAVILSGANIDRQRFEQITGTS